MSKEHNKLDWKGLTRQFEFDFVLIAVMKYLILCMLQLEFVLVLGMETCCIQVKNKVSNERGCKM